MDKLFKVYVYFISIFKCRVEIGVEGIHETWDGHYGMHVSKIRIAKKCLDVHLENVAC